MDIILIQLHEDYLLINSKAGILVKNSTVTLVYT